MPAPVPPNATKKSDVRDTYFGVTVDDPYRWLEDADSEDTRAFVDRENARMRAYVDALPGRDALSRRIAELLSLGMTSVPAVRVASVIALGAVAGNLSGTGIIELAGWSLGNGHGYAPMFAICGMAYLAALAFVQMMLPRLELANA